MTADTMVGAPPRGGQRLRLLLHSRTGMLGLVLVGFLLVLAIAQAFGLVGTDPLKQAASIRLQGPSAAHWFGTDQFGRDVFSRVAAGVANTTQIAAVAVGVAALVGTLLGVIAGFYLKGPDAIISGVTNVLFAFPPLLLALSLTSVMDRNWFTVARGPVLSLRNIEYVRAAVSTGQSRMAITMRHVLPNITSIIIVQVSLSLSWAVLTEASLSFLGLGNPPPAPSLGSMIYEARTLVSVAPWTMVAPGIVIVLLVVGLNLLGDGLRDSFDPRKRGSS